MSAGDAEQKQQKLDELRLRRLSELFAVFASTSDSALRGGASAEDLYQVFLQTNRTRRHADQDAALRKNRSSWTWRGYGWGWEGRTLSGRLLALTTGVVAVAVAVLLVAAGTANSALGAAMGVRCFLPNNFLVWEATRPIADCGICRGVDGVLELQNVSRSEFAPHAYSYRPILVKGAAADWPAMRTFSYDYFKQLYEATDGAYESVEDECQLLTFKTEFISLKEVFSMSRSRVLNLGGEQPWYIGWSNCHPSILAGMRGEYTRPQFLPADAEHAHHDFIFMGYSQGAAMHLDYISRLMWQAQLKGHKTWILTPPPECEHVCSSFSFRAEPGDIVLLDTRQWYHKTQIDGKEFSLTVSSEYG